MSSLLAMMAAVIASARPLLFDIDQATRSGSCSSFGGSCNATSTLATTTVSGGAGGYTYLWTFVSGDSFTINSSTSSSTIFNKTNAVGNVLVGTYKCTVTDDNGQTAEDTIVVTLNFIDLT